MNDDPKQTDTDDDDESSFGTDLAQALGGLMEYLQQQLTQDENRAEIVTAKIAAMPVRERQLVQEAAIVGYMLGWTDYSQRKQPTEDSVRVTARVVDRALQEPEQFIAMAADPGESDSLAEQHNQMLQKELEATKRAKQENDERFQLERDQARMERDELRRYLESLNLKTD